MSLVGSVVLPLARAYAEQAGIPVDEMALGADVERRLDLLGRFPRLAALSGALFVRRLAPLLFAGRARPFENLSPAERERVLSRLQETRRPAARALFFSVKPLLVAVTYGRSDYLRRIGVGG